MLEWLEHVITDYLGAYGYPAVFVLMVLESACIPIPSEVTMVFGGFLVSRGDLDFVWVALTGTIANVIGSWLAYWVGYAGGRPLIQRGGRDPPDRRGFGRPREPSGYGTLDRMTRGSNRSARLMNRARLLWRIRCHHRETRNSGTTTETTVPGSAVTRRTSSRSGGPRSRNGASTTSSCTPMPRAAQPSRTAGASSGSVARNTARVSSASSVRA